MIRFLRTALLALLALAPSIASPQVIPGRPPALRANPPGLRSFAAAALPGGGSISFADLTNNRVYQRTTQTGGGQGKGQGSIPVTVTLGSTSPVYAQLRAEDGTTVLQSLGQVASAQAAGTSTLTLSGVDARLGWMRLALSTDGSTWTVGTNRVGMGKIIAGAGRSNLVRWISRIATGDSGTNANLGVSISPYGVVYASYIFSDRSMTSPHWDLPADASDYDSTGIATYLANEVAAAGVNCAFVGHAHGDQSVAVFLPGASGTDDDMLYANLDAAGGFEEGLYWGSELDTGLSAAQQKADYTALFQAYAAHNALGSNFRIFLVPTSNTQNGNISNSVTVTTLSRQVMYDWAAANGSSYAGATEILITDMALQNDGAHQTQAGGIVTGRHIYRASRPGLGLAHGDQTTALTSGTFVDGSTTLSLAATSTGGTALTATGSPQYRFVVLPHNDTTMADALPVTNVAISGLNLTLTLGTAPATGQDLDVYWDWAIDSTSVSTPWANGIYDNVTDSDGISQGRRLTPTLSPITLTRTGGAVSHVGDDLTLTGSGTYGTGKFGQAFDGHAGYWTAPNTTDGLPSGNTWTVEGWVEMATADIPTTTTARWAFVQTGKISIGIGKNGKFFGGIITQSGSATFGTATTGVGSVVADGTWHFWRIVATSSGWTVYADGTSIASGGTVPTTSAATAAMNIGGSSTAYFPGMVDEVLIRNYSVANGTAPTAAYTGTETGDIALYHFDGTGTAATH